MTLPGRLLGRVFYASSAPTHLMKREVMSPSVSSTAHQTKAEVKLATWKLHFGIAKMPAINGTVARSGPEKRPMKIAGAPHFFTNSSAFGIISGFRDSGHM